MKYNLSNIMKHAWEMKREHRISMSDAMKKAWNRAKVMSRMSYTEKLEKVGGNFWEAYNKKRIYFNDLIKWYGLEYQTYKTGNISSANVRGKYISNGKAAELRRSLNYGKLYYDMKEKKWGWKDISEETAKEIIEEIEHAIA